VSRPAFLGIDIGTSGIRAACIDADSRLLTSHSIAFDPVIAEPGKNEQGKNEQDPQIWLTLFHRLLLETAEKLHKLHRQHQIIAIAVDGTSSTLIACSQDGSALSPALMYNDQQSQQQAEIIRRFAPAESAVHSATSSLAKALNLLQKYPQTQLFCHQADWLSASLSGQYGISDENNCLKMGYDSINQCWPQWLHQNTENASISKALLPRVVAPGTVIGEVKKDLIKKYRFAAQCKVIAGTTDSNAAVLATGANQIGDAVTALGSTLVIKLFSDKPLFAAEFGIYSHRLNNCWLLGGASNSGGAALLQHFTAAQLNEMTPQLNPMQATGLQYYPLPGTGERFPINDSNKQSLVTPRPASDVEFFQALLEGIARIEADAYKKLNRLGAAPVKRLFTTGGGSKNPAWTTIREQINGVNVINSEYNEASYGSALLAKQGITGSPQLNNRTIFINTTNK